MNMNKQALQRIFNNGLSAFGFTKKSPDYWYRVGVGVVQVINLQKSAYGMQFYVNLCCVPEGFEVPDIPIPKESQCPIRIRLTAVHPEQRKRIESLLDLENSSFEDAEREQGVNALVTELIVPFFADVQSVEALKSAITSNKLDEGAVTFAVKKYLGIEQE